MKKAFDKLNIYFKCVVMSGLFLLVISLGLIPLYFYKFADIPLGFIVGTGYGMISYLVTGLLEERFKKSYYWALIVSVLRLIVFAVLLILFALCYYKWDIKWINIFSYVGGYLIVSIIFAVLYVGHKKEVK